MVTKKVNGSLWCVFPKGHGVTYYAGHLRRAFIYPKSKFYGNNN